jgi:hypothetical protein
VIASKGRVSIEKDGFVEGAIFVLSLDNVDNWTDAIIQPKAHHKHKSKAERRQPPSPFSSVTVKAQFKGYGPWRVSSSTAFTHT